MAQYIATARTNYVQLVDGVTVDTINELIAALNLQLEVVQDRGKIAFLSTDCDSGGVSELVLS